MFQRGDVVRDLNDVVEAHARRLFELEEQQVGQGRLSPLDLRRKHRLATDVCVQEELRIGQQRCNAIEAAECDGRPLQEAMTSAAQIEWRLWRQRIRDKRPNFFATTAFELKSAGRTSLHEPIFRVA